MITIEKKVETTEKAYKCEVCGKEAKFPHIITNCEQGHKQKDCKHSSFIYMTEPGAYDPDYYDIYKKCKECGFRTRITVDIEKIPEKLLKEIYEALHDAEN